MNIYRVGGAVRDVLLGLAVKDIDYVVIGSTPEQMIAAGYTPVGKDFPVFLHPKSKAEYALARTERKTAPGYHGFLFHCAPDVTLEQDLQRRDLTINAMAVQIDDMANQNIVDPFGGQRDLAAKVFRHVSDAFTEDPVRILRVARFAARFAEFSIASETMQLMRTMVAAGEVDALVPERVWQEIGRGLMETHPARMLQVLHDSGALARIIPEFEQNWSKTTSPDLLQVIDFAAQQQQPLAVRWAALCVAASSNCEQICDRLKVPAEIRDIAFIAYREHRRIKDVETLSAELVIGLIERCDAFRRPERFSEILQTVRSYYLLSPAKFPQREFLEQAMAAAQSIPNAEIAKFAMQRFPNQPQKIAENILAARTEAVRRSIRAKNGSN